MPVPDLPFSPRRQWFMPALCAVLGAFLIGLVLLVTLWFPPKPKDFGGFAAVWALCLSLTFALFATQREKLTFRADGIERTSGLRRHFIAYAAISCVESQTRVGRGVPFEILVLRFNARTPTIEIWPQNFASGELSKIVAVLRQQAPHVVFDGV